MATILHLSDTHNQHRRLTGLPDADIIVHSGDFTMAGTVQEATDFINWFCDLPYKHKIFIAGNHDDCLFGANISGLDHNCHYLCNSGVSIEGIHFYGVPLFVGDNSYTKHISGIPNDTDVLITHQPPYGIMDYDGRYHYGHKDLLRKVQNVRPRLHLYGHLHAAFGRSISYGTMFSNAALMDEVYGLSQERIMRLSAIEISMP